jgi:hypothetical protein
MTAVSLPRPLRGLAVAALALAILGSALLAWLVVEPLDHDARHVLMRSTSTQTVRSEDAEMPPAPYGEAAWSLAVDRAYAAVDGGRGAAAGLRHRAAERRPGEQLAVVMGIDDVMVQTHLAGLGTLVPQSVRFARTAHRLGYAVFYVTGRTYRDGLGAIQSLLERAHVPLSGVFPPLVGSTDEATEKAQCRAAIRAAGYTIAASVASDGASFVGSPGAEMEVRLPDFAQSG